jgi:hypothetical protein
MFYTFLVLKTKSLLFEEELELFLQNGISAVALENPLIAHMQL